MTEKWLFRALLAVLLVAMTAALVGSLDDLKRYLKMQRM